MFPPAEVCSSVISGSTTNQRCRLMPTSCQSRLWSTKSFAKTCPSGVLPPSLSPFPSHSDSDSDPGLWTSEPSHLPQSRGRVSPVPACRVCPARGRSRRAREGGPPHLHHPPLPVARGRRRSQSRAPVSPLVISHPRFTSPLPTSTSPSFLSHLFSSPLHTPTSSFLLPAFDLIFSLLLISSSFSSSSSPHSSSHLLRMVSLPLWKSLSPGRLTELSNELPEYRQHIQALLKAAADTKPDAAGDPAPPALTSPHIRQCLPSLFHSLTLSRLPFFPSLSRGCDVQGGKSRSVSWLDGVFFGEMIQTGFGMLVFGGGVVLMNTYE